MVVVAVAGGNGAIGRTILEVLGESEQHQTFALSRIDAKSASASNTLRVDYTDIANIVSILESNNIHTVICAFGISDTSLSTSQLNLIKAAEQSSTTKRFIPTSFASPYPRDAISYMPSLKPHFDCIDALESSSLEYTLIHNGVFLDYYAMPHIKTNLTSEAMILDIASHVAAIPGSGDVPVTFTYSYDMARFVVAYLSLPRWTKEARIVGDTVTFNHFVRLAEEITETKFQVTYDSIEKLKKNEVTELPAHKALYERVPKEQLQWFLSIFELWVVEGLVHLEEEGSLNEVFPDIKTMSVKEMLKKYWAPEVRATT